MHGQGNNCKATEVMASPIITSTRMREEWFMRLGLVSIYIVYSASSLFSTKITNFYHFDIYFADRKEVKL